MRVDVRYNAAYSDYFQSNARHAILFGGRGSGKSVAAIQKHIVRCISVRGFRHLTIRKVLKSCRHSTFRLYRDELQRYGIPCDINRTEMTVTFPNGSEILNSGLDDPAKLLSITGIDSIHTEETDQFTEDEFEEVDVLMRGQPKGGHFQHTMTFNPRRGKFWARRRFVDAPDCGGAYILKTTWRDNAFVGKDYGARLAAIVDDNKRRIYDLGEWGEDVHGLIYPVYSTGPHPSEPPDAYGLDFGFTHATALVAIWDRDPNMHIHQVIYATNLRTPVLIESMKEARVHEDIPIYCDAARPDTIADLQADGFDARGADKAVEDGIAAVKKYQLVFSPDSIDLIDEVESYIWQKNREGALTDKPVKANDHGMDAIRYAVNSRGDEVEPDIS